MKEEHADAIEEIAKEMEKKAMTKLNETSRRALEGNTMFLRQVKRKKIRRHIDRLNSFITGGWVAVIETNL
jgi:hypothetical protein